MESRFKQFCAGDVCSVFYRGVVVALIQVTKINRYSMEGMDGEHPCKVTSVGDNSELRFYVESGPNRETVLRQVKLRREPR